MSITLWSGAIILACRVMKLMTALVHGRVQPPIRIAIAAAIYILAPLHDGPDHRGPSPVLVLVERTATRSFKCTLSRFLLRR